jgi:uncharacterized repeat protein (TIGR02543 family)
MFRVDLGGRRTIKKKEDHVAHHVGETVTVSATVPTRAGFSFAGWLYDGVIYRTVGVGSVNSFVMPAADVILVAQWVANVYTVTYAPGAQGAFAQQVHTPLSYGVATPAFTGTPTGNSGYTFNGWSPTVANTVTANVTYTAQWTASVSSSSGGTTTKAAPKVSLPAKTTSPPTEIPEPTVTHTPPQEPVPPVQTWALVNLVLSVVGIIFVVIVTIGVMLQRSQKQKRQQAQAQSTKGVYGATQNQITGKQGNGSEDLKKAKQRRLFWLLLSAIIGIVGVVVFVFTENMSHKMALVDWWTIVNAIIFIVEIIAITLIFKHKNNKDDKDNKKEDGKED